VEEAAPKLPDQGQGPPANIENNSKDQQVSPDEVPLVGLERSETPCVFVVLLFPAKPDGWDCRPDHRFRDLLS
jgi:hypothetical protein